MPEDTERNPLQEALDEYTAVKNELATANQAIRGHEKSVMELSHSLDLMTKERDRLQIQRDLFQRYSTVIHTRLSSITELITGAVHEAESHALNIKEVTLPSASITAVGDSGAISNSNPPANPG